MLRLHQLLTAAILATTVSAGAISHAAGMGSDAPADSVTSLPGYKSAETLISQQKYPEAIVELTGLNKSDDANVLNLLGYAHRQAGKVDEGIAFYLKAIEKDPKHKGAH